MALTWHVVEGAAGCAFAVERGAVAVVVDALRASATAAMLFEAGAKEIIATMEVDQARRAAERYGALLAGERDGLPPEGFDMGNSPRGIEGVAGKTVAFTTTTGAGRLLECWGAPAVYMGATVNARAVRTLVTAHEREVVLIPAGLRGEPDFDAQEDWAAACYIADQASAPIGEGAAQFHMWQDALKTQGLRVLFRTAPHAAKLRRADLGEDVVFCAQTDLTACVPKATRKLPEGLLLRAARAK
jgi:2-phosphosulfolactate phosphatase